MNVHIEASARSDRLKDQAVNAAVRGLATDEAVAWLNGRVPIPSLRQRAARLTDVQHIAVTVDHCIDTRMQGEPPNDEPRERSGAVLIKREAANVRVSNPWYVEPGRAIRVAGDDDGRAVFEFDTTDEHVFIMTRITPGRSAQEACTTVSSGAWPPPGSTWAIKPWAPTRTTRVEQDSSLHK